MVKKENRSAEEKRHAMANLIWMNYFNEYLFQKNLITEKERNRMKNEIASKFQIGVSLMGNTKSIQ